MKAFKDFKLLAILATIMLLHSCRQDFFEPEEEDNLLKSGSIAYNCNDCFPPGGPYPEQQFQTVVQWGGNKNNKFTKKVDAIVYNTTEHIVLKIKSSHKISNIRIKHSDGKTEHITGTGPKETWIEKTYTLPENWEVCDPFGLELTLIGEGPRAILKIDYKLKEECREITSVTDIDGNVYPAAKIGEQYWMGKNLMVSRYRNGDPIKTGLTGKDWELSGEGARNVYSRLYPFYDNINSVEEVRLIYGELYNWFAVDDARGLCPTGWHVPSMEELMQMIEFIVSDNENVYRDHSANLLKATSGWVRSGIGQNGTDIYGFTALPGGYITPGGSPWLRLYFAYFWTSTGKVGDNSSPGSAHYYRMEAQSFLPRMTMEKTAGMSIRCIKSGKRNH
jgi:uncharacterized protein (TIGR02145 family)